jgi:two-component system chemotaxis response regulator CheY
MLHGSKMLVVDDFATMARIMKSLAQRIGFTEVDICHDGDAALHMARARKYDVVLCDIKMDPIDGVAFSHLLRAEPNGRDCVVLLTTADRHAAAAVVSTGILSLVDGLILKPFNSQELADKLAEIAARRRAGGGDVRIEPQPAPNRPRLHS